MSRVLMLEIDVGKYKGNNGKSCVLKFYSDNTYTTDSFKGDSRWKIEDGVFYFKHAGPHHEWIDWGDLYQEEADVFLEVLDVDREIEKFLDGED